MSRPSTWRLDPGEAGYPSELEDLRAYLDEPELPVLHGCGESCALTDLDHDAAVTIVGSRRPSRYGVEVAEELARDLALAGATVISGMAHGIDAAAHRGALAGGGATIAVLAGGPDVPYPPSSRGLYGRILGAGAAIAEREPGTVPERWSFVARNRIMAALGKAVIVVEGADPSGSMITAERGADMHREVCGVPGTVGARMAALPHRLIKEGAHLIESAQDVLDLLAGVGAGSVRRTGPELEPALAAALELVEAGCATSDALALAGGLASGEAAVALARLELLGYVTADAAGRYCRTPLVAHYPAAGGQ